MRRLEKVIPEFKPAPFAGILPHHAGHPFRRVKHPAELFDGFELIELADRRRHRSVVHKRTGGWANV